LPIVEQEALHAVRAAASDLGLLAEANAFALLAEAQRAPLALTAIEPQVEMLRKRLTEVATCSTLIALVLIDVLRNSGHVEHARHLTDEIIVFAIAHDEKVYLPELLRIRGEQRQSDDPEMAERDYREAIELAKTTGARIFEGRAAENLAAVIGAATA
jgi:hypothetical protein